jgi:Cu/Ag efflux pump CusA
VIANKSDDEDVLISLLNYSLKMDRGNYVASIPVRSIVKVGRERGLSEIYRENGNRAVVVLASASGKNILSLSGEIGKILNDVERSHPSFLLSSVER